jgi:hypothetical protein
LAEPTGEVILRRVRILKLKTCLLVVCGFMIAFAQSSQTDNAAKETIGRARAAYMKKDFALARKELELVSVRVQSIP